MRKIIYYVAVSLDGFISGPEEDISCIIVECNGVEQYLADLQSLDTVIMGRRICDFGYDYEFNPGQPAIITIILFMVAQNNFSAFFDYFTLLIDPDPFLALAIPVEVDLCGT